jgi:hypothetical protein
MAIPPAEAAPRTPPTEAPLLAETSCTLNPFVLVLFSYLGTIGAHHFLKTD